MTETIVALYAASGDLSGNWSWTVWLLIPLVVLLALVTALVLGPLGEPARSRTTERGVSTYLARRPPPEEDPR